MVSTVNAEMISPGRGRQFGGELTAVRGEPGALGGAKSLLIIGHPWGKPHLVKAAAPSNNNNNGEQCKESLARQRSAVIRNPSEAISMTPVAIHPTTRRYGGRTNLPTIARFSEMSINKNINGTATIPLITADKKSARIGSIPTKFKHTPRMVAPERT